VKKKRLVIIADLHSGHEYGITPPRKWRPLSTKAGKFERALWGFYTKALDALKPIDILVVNGDAIEGRGEKTGGVELITSDCLEQVRMAREAIEYAEAPAVRILYGTQYHTGASVDYESALIDSVDCKDVKAHGHGFFSVNGLNFDIKHKVGSSTIPHGRFTALARSRLWNVIWNAEGDRQPRADVVIRSHVHFFGYCGAESWLAVSSPALCYNSIYGVRSCEGLVDIGLLAFDIDSKDKYSWWPVLAKFTSTKVFIEAFR
jgi:hypothetical protein